jgi:hypothetical protein
MDVSEDEHDEAILKLNEDELRELPGAPVFYVSISNKKGEEWSVKDEDTSNWGPHWTSINDEFEAKLALNPYIRFLSSRMFFVCNGNHRFKAWTGYISRLHSNDQ